MRMSLPVSRASREPNTLANTLRILNQNCLGSLCLRGGISDIISYGFNREKGVFGIGISRISSNSLRARSSIQNCPYLLRVFSALAVAGDQFNLAGVTYADSQLEGAGNLLLLENSALTDFGCGAVVAQQSNADCVYRHTISSGQDNVAMDEFAAVRPAGNEGFHSVEHD